MKLEVLISCMHQSNFGIVERTRVKSSALVINQSDSNEIAQVNYNGYVVRMFSTIERGLSRSRNMAITNAVGDICLICDDDEVLEDDYVETILSAFDKYAEADILTFKVNSPQKHSYPSKTKKVGYIGAMKTASWQIAFKRKSIVDNNIRFDEKMGSGTGNGCGEENKFLFDCLKKKLKIQYVPYLIASVAQTDSKWFKGYTNIYFYNRGYSNRRLLGLPLAWLYGIYFSIVKYNEYKADNTFWNALRYQLRGVYKNV